MFKGKPQARTLNFVAMKAHDATNRESRLYAAVSCRMSIRNPLETPSPLVQNAREERV